MEKELVQHAPVLTAVLKAACGPTLYSNSKTAFIVMAAAVLFKGRSKHACLLQSLIGIILYTGHASKAVCTFITFFQYNNAYLYR